MLVQDNEKNYQVKFAKPYEEWYLENNTRARVDMEFLFKCLTR